MNLLRFRQILSELFNEGKDIFRSGEHAVRLANLTSALNQLADEAETQQLMEVPDLLRKLTNQLG